MIFYFILKFSFFSLIIAVETRRLCVGERVSLRGCWFVKFSRSNLIIMLLLLSLLMVIDLIMLNSLLWFMLLFERNRELAFVLDIGNF